MAPNSVMSTWSLNGVACCCWCLRDKGEDRLDGRKRCRRMELWILVGWCSWLWIRKDCVDEQRRCVVLDDETSCIECWRPWTNSSSFSVSLSLFVSMQWAGVESIGELKVISPIFKCWLYILFLAAKWNHRVRILEHAEVLLTNLEIWMIHSYEVHEEISVLLPGESRIGRKGEWRWLLRI